LQLAETATLAADLRSIAEADIRERADEPG
jgi:hypothetical protein